MIAHPAGLTVLFTQRTQHLKSHSGQVSFPGGRAEPGDASLEFTALREAKERSVLPPNGVEMLGRLPDYHTRTGFRVTPVMGLVTPPLELEPDPREVEAVFEVPLAFLLDERNHERRTREFQGKTLGFYAIRVPRPSLIWGATAGMLVHDLRIECSNERPCHHCSRCSLSSGGRSARARRVQTALAAWAGWLEQSFNGGERQPRPGGMAGGMVPPIALAIMLHALSSAAWPVRVRLLDIGVLYLTLGFSQVSHTSPTSSWRSRRATSTAPARSSRNGAAPRASCERGRR